MGLGRQGVGMPRVDGGQGGVGTPKWMWGEVWGAGTPSGDVGVQPMGYSSLLGSGRGVWGPPRGVVGMVGCRETKGSLGTPKRGCRDGAKGVWGGGSKEVGNGDPERGWGERWGVRTP